MEIGKDVVLQKFSGNKVEEFDGIVIGVNADSLNIAYFDQSKAALLGGVDWRLAFERQNDVKESAHEDVQAGKEGFAYRLDAEDAAEVTSHAVVFTGEAAAMLHDLAYSDAPKGFEDIVLDSANAEKNK